MSAVMSSANKVIFGPMFSGKTTELIRRLKRYQVANYKCLIIKYANDDRYSNDGIATHDKQTLAAVSATKLTSLKDIAIDYDVIGIDEGQFFCDVVSYAEEMANSGKIVIVAALDGTFQRVGFGDILNLVPLAESVVKLNAVCMACFSDASYTKRIGNEKQVEIIGGTDKYMAVCRECHFSPQSKRSTPSKMSPANKKTPLKYLAKENAASPPKKRLFEDESAMEYLPLKCSQ